MSRTEPETMTPPVAGKAMELARRMLRLVAEGTTDRADAPMALPAREFLDEGRFAAELDVLFRREPVFAGLSAELPEPGCYKTLDLPGAPLLLARGQDGALRAFLNACRHRGSALAKGAGRTSAFVCPYHGWTYALSGGLKRVRSAELFGPVDAACRGLIEMAAAERHGLMFVRATPLAEDARPLDVDGALCGLGPQMAEWALERTRPQRSTAIPVAANWKLAVDTYLETYHFAVLHPKTVAQTHFADHATFDAYGPHQLAGFTGKSIGKLAATPEAEWEPLRHLQFIYFLFPNTVLTVMRDHVEYFQTLPGRSIRECRTDYVYFTYPGSRFAAKDVADERFERELSILVEEDCPMAASMQANLETGRLESVLFGRNEPGLQHFHRSCQALLERG